MIDYEDEPELSQELTEAEWITQESCKYCGCYYCHGDCVEAIDTQRYPYEEGMIIGLDATGQTMGH